MKDKGIKKQKTQITKETTNLITLTWVGTIFFGFVPSLILYLVKKDDAYLQEQSKEALNWAITEFFGLFIGWILMFVLIGILVIPVVLICNAVFCIMGAVATSKGESFRVPFAIRLIK